jgi:hypothetical protein
MVKYQVAFVRYSYHGDAMSGLAQDFGYAFRVIRSRPAPSTVIVFTLALGIGINTMFFSSFYSMILRPMPLRNQSSL